MPQRTTPAAVQSVLQGDYDTIKNPSLQPFIDTAWPLVDMLASEVGEWGDNYSSQQLERIECWLSAWFYTAGDPIYQSRSNLRGSGSFVRDPKDPNPYKQMATSMDPTGTLSAILDHKLVGMAWLGKPKSAQIPYDQRN